MTRIEDSNVTVTLDFPIQKRRMFCGMNPKHIAYASGIAGLGNYFFFESIFSSLPMDLITAHFMICCSFGSSIAGLCVSICSFVCGKASLREPYIAALGCNGISLVYWLIALAWLIISLITGIIGGNAMITLLFIVGQIVFCAFFEYSLWYALLYEKEELQSEA